MADLTTTTTATVLPDKSTWKSDWSIVGQLPQQSYERVTNGSDASGPASSLPDWPPDDLPPVSLPSSTNQRDLTSAAPSGPE